MKLLAIFAALLAAAAVGDAAVMICQYASWAVYRSDGGKFAPDDVDPTLCTHGVYITAGLDANDNMVSLDPWADLKEGGGLGGYEKFTGLKDVNPDFKAILALGGWANANYQFGVIAANPDRRTAMAANVVAFLQKYNFDGIELDWLYPANASEKKNFPLLLATLREAFEPEGFELLITVAPLETIVEQAYDLVAIEPSVNYMLIIAYDYEGAWNLWTGHTTPLYVDTILCVDATVQVYLSQGVSPGKLVLGFPGFGRTWTLADMTETDVGAIALGPGYPGTYSRTPGILNYNEIVEGIADWTIERDTESKAPWAYNGDQWLSMDDEVSATFKAEYAATNGLAGAAIWTIDTDYFENGAFSLIRAITAGFAKQRK